MPSADQIRESLEVRIERLETELRKLRAAHTALAADAPGASTDGAQTGTGRGRRPASRGVTESERIPPSVLRVFAEWEARGRPVQAPVPWQRERWLAVMPGQAPVLETLPDRLDRSTVRQLVLEKAMTTIAASPTTWT